jgi:hypothetical protein
MKRKTGIGMPSLSCFPRFRSFLVKSLLRGDCKTSCNDLC